MIPYTSFHTLKRYFFNAVCSVVAPPSCAACNSVLSQRGPFCTACCAQIQPVVSCMVPITSTTSMKVYAATAYTEPIKSLILAKRWSSIIASTQLGEYVWQKSNIRSAQADYLVPIPLHWTRYAWRGFNQAQEIASVVGKKCNVPVVTLLKRVRRTQFQAGLDGVKRAHNIAGAFCLTKKGASASTLYRGKHIVLVDDLMTTGATLREAARIVQALKPASISAVVVARTLP